MKHDEKCESFMVTPGGFTDCACFDRAIARARREGRIEGFELGWNRGVDWCVANPTDIADIALGQCEEAVDDEWPEDKP